MFDRSHAGMNPSQLTVKKKELPQNKQSLQQCPLRLISLIPDLATETVGSLSSLRRSLVGTHLKTYHLLALLQLLLRKISFVLTCFLWSQTFDTCLLALFNGLSSESNNPVYYLRERIKFMTVT